MGEAVTVMGIGCRRGTSAEDILAAVATARGSHALDALAILAAKNDEPGIAEAARRLGLPLVVADPAGTEDRLATRSAASLAATGTGSACEAAALAAAGPGARLLAHRHVEGRVTVAIARSPR
jgi:cobalt-precorrin 5A hydrolase